MYRPSFGFFYFIAFFTPLLANAEPINVAKCLQMNDTAFFTASEMLEGKKVTDLSWNISNPASLNGKFDFQIEGDHPANVIGFAINHEAYVETTFECAIPRSSPKTKSWTITVHQPRSADCPLLTEETKARRSDLRPCRNDRNPYTRLPFPSLPGR